MKKISTFAAVFITALAIATTAMAQSQADECASIRRDLTANAELADQLLTLIALIEGLKPAQLREHELLSLNLKRFDVMSKILIMHTIKLSLVGKC